MDENTKIYIKVSDGGRVPVSASEHSAGYDLFATADMTIQPGETKIMPMNFVMALQPDVEAQVRPRSGMSLKTSLRISNSPGTIDSDYRDMVSIIVENTFNPYNLALRVHYDEELRKSLYHDYKHIDSLGQKIFIDKDGYPYGTIYINKGDRIAQMVFAKHLHAEFEHTERPEEIGHNRGGGFGHTGK